MTEHENPYLALRAAKIARNKARLRELGLDGRSNFADSNRKKRKSAASDPHDEKGPVRRSPRTRKAKEGLMKVEPEVVIKKKKQERFRPSKSITNARPSTSAVPESENEPATRSLLPTSLDTNSARAMNLDMNKLVLGDEQVKGFLGHQLDRYGKAPVMELSADKAVDGFSGGPISFNKYSGVQQWGNDTLFLWINLGAPQSEVINDFLSSGKQVTWFGGSRMHDESNVIKHLIKVGKKGSERSPSTGIVLWCREYSRESKGFGPYICCGRLAYQYHEPGSRPLRFVWNLLDHERLMNHPERPVADRFQNLVQKFGGYALES